MGAAWALAHCLFKTPLVWDPLAVLGVCIAVPTLTAGTGLWSSRGLYARPCR